MIRATRLGLVVFAFAAASAASAAELALDHTGGVGYARGSFANFGWTFTTSEARSITALGLFDTAADGLAERHEVGIWNSDGALVASAVVFDQPLVASTSAAGAWRFATIGPTYMAAGAYTIGAFYVTAADAFIGSSTDNEVVVSTPAWLSYGEGKVTTGGTEIFTRPDTSVSDQFNPAFFGPNFLSAAAVPEPAAWALMILGFGGVGGALRRRAPRPDPVTA